MPFVSSSVSLKCIMTVDFVWATPNRNGIRYFADEEKNQFMESNRDLKVNNVFKCIIPNIQTLDIYPATLVFPRGIPC